MALGTKAGSIYLDLNINKKGFQSQLNGIKGIAAKAGMAIAAAFTVKQIIDFGKECIELGSDLAEVQNVVDVTFPRMTEAINDFAQNAAAKFGLSETMAKRFTGTFGSMAEAFGFTESKAADMATTLTGLAGDVASFYNITQDEAYTKLKSVFTGETESLKDLGVVMTQTALDQYALANGFGKTTKAMTEAEKVSLRYAFVQSQLTNAAGDFARTSDSWANQARVLKLQFDSLKASIGQGLINILKPVIKWLNVVIAKLAQAAKAFAEFTSLFTKGSNNTSSIANDIASAANSGVDLSDSADSASTGLSKAASAASKLKRTLLGFDRITKLDEEDDSDSGSSGSGSGSGGISDITNGIASASQDAADAIDKAYSPAIEKIKQGFVNAFKADPSPLKKSFQSLKESSKAVWGSKEVKTSVSNFKSQALTTLGEVAGSVVSMASSFAVGVVGGIASAKESLLDFNKTKISSIFDNLTGFLDLVGELEKVFADIATVFESPAFQKIVEVLAKIFNVVIMSMIDQITGLLKDLFNLVAKPFIDNADKIKELLNNVFTLLSLILEPIDKLFDTIAEKSQAWDDSWLHKALEFLAEGMSGSLSIGLTLLNGMLESIIGLLSGNMTLNDVWQKITQSEFIPEPIKTALEATKKAFEAVGKVLSGEIKLGDVWKKLFPFFFEKKEPKEVKVTLGAQIKQKWNDIKQKWENLTKSVKDKTAEMKSQVKQKWSNIEKKWTDLTTNVKEKVADMKARVPQTWNSIKTAWTNLTSNVKDKIASMWAQVASKWSDLSWSWSGVVNNIKDKTAYMRAQVGSKWSDLKGTWNGLLDNFKDKTVNLSLKFSAAAQDLKDWINTNVIDKVNNKFSTVPILKKIQIPHLAQGGYVRANTPQLALIGDNRHQGEVVAPEKKMIEMARQAAALAGSGGHDAEIVSLLKQILVALSNLKLVADVDVYNLKKLIVQLINDRTRATGMCEIEI